MGVVAEEELIGFLALGELALNGKLAAVAGVLPAASADLGLISPATNGPEAAWAGHSEIVAAPDLLALINHKQKENTKHLT